MYGELPMTFAKQAMCQLMTVRLACHIVWDQGGGNVAVRGQSNSGAPSPALGNDGSHQAVASPAPANGGSHQAVASPAPPGSAGPMSGQSHCPSPGPGSVSMKQ